MARLAGSGSVAVVAALALCMSSSAMAQSFTAREARAMLFPPAQSEAMLLPDTTLSQADLAVIEQIAATQRYYGAVAVSPEEGIASNATVAAVSYNDVGAAGIAALAECNAKRREGAAGCILVAEIRPEGWEPRPLQLGADATGAFRKDYGRGFGARAMAVSASTGKWGIAKGSGAADAAVAQCAAQSGAADCRVVIAD